MRQTTPIRNAATARTLESIVKKLKKLTSWVAGFVIPTDAQLPRLVIS